MLLERFRSPGSREILRIHAGCGGFRRADFVAVYAYGIIVARHHIIAAVCVDAQGNGKKHVLGLVPGSSETAKMVKDLLGALAQRGFDLNIPRLWVIDGSPEFDTK